jgi:hypothetical protein
MNSILMSTKTQRRFSIPVETTAVSPAMINLLTGVGISSVTASKPNSEW